MSGFRPRAHFASGQVAKCFRCERLAEDAWPPGWVMYRDGFKCPWCYVEELDDPELVVRDDGVIVRLP